MVQGIPTQAELAPILFSEDFCKQFLVNSRIILVVRTCEVCNENINLDVARESYRHSCRGRQREMSMWKNTLFSKSKLKPCQIMNLLYWWLIGASHTILTAMGSHSPKTITNFVKDVNQMVSNMLVDDDTIIGGEGIVVELDETKMAKRKYHIGHQVQGIWILGGVERTPERKMFAVPVPNRSTETIARIIERHVLPGSTINTDFWKGYDHLDNSENYIHMKVNHSKNFKDPTTGTHTNTIEGTWAALKGRISKRYRCEAGIGNNINVFIWRRQNCMSLWAGLMAALADYHWIE
jgi:ISXO2-like transposase domain